MTGPFIAWTCLLAAYMVLAGQVSADEIVAGSLCAAAGVFWWIGTRRASQRAFAFGSGSWVAAGRACLMLPAAVLRVAAVLLRTLFRQESGTIAYSFFAHGKRYSPDDAGRRAIGVLAASVAPDSFVLRTPIDRDEIIVHAFRSGAPPKDPRWPI